MKSEEAIRRAIEKAEEQNHQVEVISMKKEISEELAPDLTLETMFGYPIVVSDRNRIIFTRKVVDSIEFGE